MDKLLRLYTYVDGVNDTLFLNSDNPIEIGEFRYDAKRMGGAPTITASVYYPSCLDDVWTDNVYAKFNGEKYYLKQTPTSSYNNESTMYKHDLELVSERVILDNVYFFDAVAGDPQDNDKPVSNSTKVVFFGNIHEFVKRLNSSLEYAKLLKWEDGVDDNGNAIKIPNGYYVVVDTNANITTEEKLMSFEDQFFSNVLQEIYNTYEVPYYFEGKTIHIGYSNKNAVVPTFSYGVDDALLSITKNNANYKIVNRATATGSSDNIPFYYPNNSPKGDIAATPSGNFEVKILDTELYSNEIKLDGVIRKSNVEYENAKVGFGGKDNYDGETLSAVMGKGGIDKKCVIEFISKEAGIFLLSFSSSVTKYILEEEEKSDATFRIRYFIEVYDRTANKFTYDSNGNLSSIEDFEVPVPHANHKYEIFIKCYYAVEGKYAGKGGRIEYNATYSFGSKSGWMYEDKVVDLKDVGLEVVGDTVVGDTITQTLVKYIKTSQNLMPSIYRETYGAERFYNATNDTYEGVSFNNPYVEGRPKEHIFTVEDIKPTIKDTKVRGLRIDMFSEFAYDDDDNDETYEDEEGDVYFKHPYFYGKLRVMDFNLFDHAIEQQPMTISFTSGHCGACNFEIGVTEDYPQKNPVQVYESDTLIDGVLHKAGSLKRDKNGMVLAGVEGTQQQVTTFQERQQDTSKYEVWIALRKEEETYGILMPQVAHRPKACTEGQNDGDTFVIIGINLPQSYIINAEKKLEAEIIKYLKDNNDEKFTFSIGFSRIYFEENNILDQLSENSKIRIIYDNKPYDLYVSSFSYSMSEGEVLPEIRVELDETLKVSQNALQNAISQVKSELGRAIGSIDVVGAATPYFIRKDTDDEAQGRINFKKGIKFGEGGKVEIMPDNGAKLTIDYIEVTKKATFNSLEIAEKKHVGGQILLTPAAMKCGEVEEFDDYYRCYFQTKSEGGDEIFNQFAVNDQAICQTFNAWGNRYYWRLVVGVGEDYIDLSKTDCDEYSDIPSVGDSIILLGNRTDITRQAAIVLSAYDDNAPSLIMYNGINSYSLVEKNITGIIWNPETIEPQMYSYGSFFFGDRQLNKNFITFQKKDGDTDKNLYINGKLTIGAGSEGLSNLSEWSDKQTQINNAQTSADNAKVAADNAQVSADNAQNTANDAKSIATNAQGRVGLLESTTSNLSTQITDIENNITETVEDINKRLDGVVENYFEEGVPTTDNYPANQWTTDNDKRNHIGDTYTNINTYETDPENAGKSWRWVNTDSEHSGYHWHPIADSDAVKALQDAYKAQTTADGKSTTFLRTPDNYSEGDLWILQSDTDHAAGKKGEILTANKSSVAYDASHWTKEVVYTDDTNLNNFIGGEFATYKTNIQNQIDKKAQTWYQPTDPSIQWTTTSDKNEHIGDMWLNTSSSTVAGVEAGMTAIWNGSAWKSSAVPQEVFNKINGKAQVFVSQPTTPYYVGDLWSSENSRLLKCNKTRLTGNFDSSEWGNADNSREYADSIGEEIHNSFDYLKVAMKQDTTVEGGLIQSSILSLGYTDTNGIRHIMSGTNGVYNASALGGGIAAWYGGAMSEDSAKTVLRFDGSGFFANKNIAWDNEGGVSFAGGQLSITKNGALILGNNIAFGSDGDETIQSIISKLSVIMTWFQQYDENTIYTPFNLVTGRQIAAAQAGTSSGGGIGSIIFTGPWSDYTSEKSDYALAASLGYDLHTRVTSLEGKATNVKFTQVIAAGKQIGSISIDGASTNLYAPSTYDWGEITNKPTTIAGFGITDAYTASTIDSKLSGYLPLSGGALSGNNDVLNINSLTEDSWIYFKTSNTNKAAVGYYDGLAFISNEKTYARIGVNDSGTPQYWSTTNPSTAQTIYHSGNLTASVIYGLGTLSNNISGNAATASRAKYIETLSFDGNSWYGDSYKMYAQWIEPTICELKVDGYKTMAWQAKELHTARTIWGQSFDGTGNVDGSLHIYSTGNSWNEGIRMHAASDGWSGVTMCGSDNTGATGTSPNTWGVHNNEGNFYINRYGSNHITPYILCNIDGNWGIGTTTPQYKLDVAGTGRFTDAVTLSSTLTVGGNTTVNGTLGVSGATTLGSTLQIGSATLTWNGSALVVDKPLVSTSFAAGATATASSSSGSAPTTATAEWYNLRTTSNGCNGLSGAPIVAIENYDDSMASTLSDTSMYRMCLMTLKKHWRIPMLTPRWNPDDGTVIKPNTASNIAWGDTWWPVSDKIVTWFSNTGKVLNTVGLGFSKNINNKFSTTGSKRRYLGCAIFKKTGKGHSGWERVSNIAKIAVFAEQNGYNIRIIE